ncbi:MAG: hypothetical protein CM15mV145_300 [uncultured marine virus]|nr:MAG: hypothetical protein CM15mV145_300 [uncultured marine virus]
MMNRISKFRAGDKRRKKNNAKRKKQKYESKQMKIARVAEPRNRITSADFRKLRKNAKKKK